MESDSNLIIDIWFIVTSIITIFSIIAKFTENKIDDSIVAKMISFLSLSPRKYKTNRIVIDDVLAKAFSDKKNKVIPESLEELAKVHKKEIRSKRRIK